MRNPLTFRRISRACCTIVRTTQIRISDKTNVPIGRAALEIRRRALPGILRISAHDVHFEIVQALPRGSSLDGTRVVRRAPKNAA